MDMQRVADLAREWRWKARLTQSEAADLIGVSRATYLGLESGAASPRTVAAWAAVAGYSLELHREKGK